MELKKLFLKADNELESSSNKIFTRKITCKKCESKISVSKIRKNYFICPECGHYFSVRARRRILMLTDKRSFIEMEAELQSRNVIEFHGNGRGSIIKKYY